MHICVQNPIWIIEWNFVIHPWKDFAVIVDSEAKLLKEIFFNDYAVSTAFVELYVICINSDNAFKLMKYIVVYDVVSLCLKCLKL